jgi:hypothetical protein
LYVMATFSLEVHVAIDVPAAAVAQLIAPQPSRAARLSWYDPCFLTVSDREDLIHMQGGESHGSSGNTARRVHR